MRTLRTISGIIVMLLLTSCFHNVRKESRVSAHRLIYFPKLNENEIKESKDKKNDKSSFKRSPKLDVALTNISGVTLCSVSAKVIGLGKTLDYPLQKRPRADSRTVEGWEPGEVWFLNINEDFDCRIPLNVEVFYRVLKTTERGGSSRNNTATGVCADHQKQTMARNKKDLKSETVEMPKRPTAIGVEFLRACPR